MEKLISLFIFNEDGRSKAKRITIVADTVLIISCLQLTLYIFGLSNYNLDQSNNVFQAIIFKYYLGAYLVFFVFITFALVMTCDSITLILYTFVKLFRSKNIKYNHDTKVEIALLVNKVASKATAAFTSLYILYCTVVKDNFSSLYSFNHAFASGMILILVFGFRVYSMIRVDAAQDQATSKKLETESSTVNEKDQ